jgi:hypothetical protein
MIYGDKTNGRTKKVGIAKPHEEKLMEIAYTTAALLRLSIVNR